MLLYCVGSFSGPHVEYAQNGVQSFNISHPGKVKYYIVDDYKFRL